MALMLRQKVSTVTRASLFAIQQQHNASDFKEIKQFSGHFSDHTATTVDKIPIRLGERW
jgi:hypothetical protein